jgi:hypothetical protein
MALRNSGINQYRKVPVTIGGIELDSINTPESLILGTDLIHSLQQFPGGKRVVQTFGNKPPEKVCLKGKWINEDAEERSDQMERLAKSGNKVNLVWGAINWPGVVVKYKVDWKNRWIADFELEFVPLTVAGSSVGASPSTGGTATPQNVIQQSLNQIKQLYVPGS